MGTNARRVYAVGMHGFARPDAPRGLAALTGVLLSSTLLPAGAPAQDAAVRSRAGTYLAEIVDPFESRPATPAAVEIIDPFVSAPRVIVRATSEILDPFRAVREAMPELLDPWSS